MFRFAANAHGWPMRVVEHRPVACVPSPENIRDSPLPPDQRVTNPLGAQTESLCSADMGLPPQAPDVHHRAKNHVQRVETPQHDRRDNEWRREAPNSYSAFNASRTTAPVRSMSPVECAVEMKPVSNCDGAK
jgi:hypothetical protein